MGASGEDIQLSSAARLVFPFQVECKNRKAIAVFKDYEQAQTHGLVEPLVVLKQNNSKPLVLVDAEYFFELVRRTYDTEHSRLESDRRQH